MDCERANELEQERLQQIAEELPAELREATPATDWKPATGSDPLATCVDRRVFLRGGAGLIGGLALSWPLQEMMGRKAFASGSAVPSPYGVPEPAIDESTGLALIKLPPGFRYLSYGWTGDKLTAGHITPNLHDGMAVIRQVGPRLVLCRNHETGAGAAFAGGGIQYSPNAAGGNTNVIFNTHTEKFEKAWATLSGTIRNCAGGLTPWGTWISSEETFSSTTGGFLHGWNFDVPAYGNATGDPLTAMGRFSHEAVVVDPATGYVYETEDAGDTSGFYRFLPNVYGQLHLGGTLQMLKVVGVHQADLRGFPTQVPCGTTWDVEWVTIADPDGVPTSCFSQGRTLGAARFRRLEGCWYGDGLIYFLGTDAGVAREGQVFEFDPIAQKLTLIYESSDFEDVDNPDNMVVTPRGGLLLCEDNAGGQGSHAEGERLVGLTLGGGTFTFAVNQCNFDVLGSYTRDSGVTFTGNQTQNEWAGACYSPDGQWLFANVQTPGVTFAITGPWGAGPL